MGGGGKIFAITSYGRAYPAEAGSIESLRCPICEWPLNVLQPEENAPNRLLGSCSCEECALWFYLALTPARSEVYMIRMPEVFEIREAISEGDPGGADGRGGRGHGSA